MPVAARISNFSKGYRFGLSLSPGHTIVLPTMINTTQGDLRSSHNNDDPLSERTLVTT